jgi:hypothetical protein
MNEFLNSLSVLWGSMTDDQKRVFAEVIVGK